MGAHTDQTARPSRKTRWESAPDKPKEYTPIRNWCFWTSKRRNLEFEMIILGGTNRRPDGGFDEIKNQSVRGPGR